MIIGPLRASLALAELIAGVLPATSMAETADAALLLRGLAGVGALARVTRRAR